MSIPHQHEQFLPKWKTNPTMKNVCLDTRCPYHDSNNIVSQMFRNCLAAISKSSDQAINSQGEEDLPLRADGMESEDDLEYLRDMIDANMHLIASDPTQLIRPECTLTDKKMLQRQGNAEVFYPSLYNQQIFKTNTKDTLDDTIFVISVNKPMGDWLEFIGYYSGENNVTHVPRSIILAYHSMSLDFASAKNLSLPEQLTSVIENPESNTSLRFAAGVGCAGIEFVKYKKQTKNTKNRTKNTADGPPYLSLGGLQSITLPCLPAKGDRVRPNNITNTEFKRRMSVVSPIDQTISPSFILPNSLLQGDDESKVMINSVHFMNPMVFVSRSTGADISPIHKRLIEAVNEGVKRNRSVVVIIPFPAVDYSDKRLAKIAATPILQSPSCYDPGFWYHIATLKFGDDESLQLLVVTKKFIGGGAICFLQQNKDKTLSFKTENVFVWALPPIINGNKKLAKVAYSTSCATGYSPTARAFFAADFLPAFVINTENSHVMSRVIAHEVFKFIDVKACNNRLTKVLEVVGYKIKNSAQLKLHQKQIEPLMDILSHKLRLASTASKGELYVLQRSWITQSNTHARVNGVPVLDVNTLFCSLACRKKPVNIQPCVTNKSVKEPKVVQSIFNAPSELEAAIYPTGFPQLVKNMDANNRANNIRVNNESRRLSTDITHLKLQDAARLGDTRRIGELCGQVVKLSAEERGHDTSLYDSSSLLQNDLKRPREIEKISDVELADFCKSTMFDNFLDSEDEMDPNILDAESGPMAEGFPNILDNNKSQPSI